MFVLTPLFLSDLFERRRGNEEFLAVSELSF